MENLVNMEFLDFIIEKLKLCPTFNFEDHGVPNSHMVSETSRQIQNDDYNTGMKSKGVHMYIIYQYINM